MLLIGGPMTDTHASRTDLKHVLERFPEDTLRIRRLFLADATFRSVCEDYGLARDSLARFESFPDAAQRPEVDDYRTVIAELEAEITALLRASAGSL